jgi:hypothetical protein
MTTQAHRFHDDDAPLAPVIPLFRHAGYLDGDDPDDFAGDDFAGDDDQGLILRYGDDGAGQYSGEFPFGGPLGAS